MRFLFASILFLGCGSQPAATTQPAAEAAQPCTKCKEAGKTCHCKKPEAAPAEAAPAEAPAEAAPAAAE